MHVQLLWNKFSEKSAMHRIQALSLIDLNSGIWFYLLNVVNSPMSNPLDFSIKKAYKVFPKNKKILIKQQKNAK